MSLMESMFCHSLAFSVHILECSFCFKLSFYKTQDIVINLFLHNNYYSALFNILFYIDLMYLVVHLKND